MRDDGPEFLHALINRVRAGYPVDSRRIYVFGAVHGAMHALAMAVLEPEYFAGIVTDGGVLMKELVPYLARLSRRVPLAMWTDKNDDFFSVAERP